MTDFDAFQQAFGWEDEGVERGAEIDAHSILDSMLAPPPCLKDTLCDDVAPTQFNCRGSYVEFLQALDAVASSMNLTAVPCKKTPFVIKCTYKDEDNTRIDFSICTYTDDDTDSLVVEFKRNSDACWKWQALIQQLADELPLQSGAAPSWDDLMGEMEITNVQLPSTAPSSSSSSSEKKTHDSSKSFDIPMPSFYQPTLKASDGPDCSPGCLLNDIVATLPLYVKVGVGVNV